MEGKARRGLVGLGRQWAKGFEMGSPEGTRIIGGPPWTSKLLVEKVMGGVRHERRVVYEKGLNFGLGRGVMRGHEGSLAPEL